MCTAYSQRFSALRLSSCRSTRSITIYAATWHLANSTQVALRAWALDTIYNSGSEVLSYLGVFTEDHHQSLRPMSALENSGSLQIELIRKWQRGFREKNFDILSEHLHEEFRHHTYPRSLNIPEENKEAWLKHTQERINMVTSVEASCTGCYHVILQLTHFLR